MYRIMSQTISILIAKCKSPWTINKSSKLTTDIICRNYGAKRKDGKRKNDMHRSIFSTEGGGGGGGGQENLYGPHHLIL